VSDTGVGIPPDVLPRIFDRFHQADPSSKRGQDGLGLGLSIVQNLVDLHGGRIHAESPGEGQGAVFTVVLPCARGSGLPPVPGSSPGANRTG
jgi:two-component system, chemotaxis family, CheB/CheR fusion protein